MGSDPAESLVEHACGQAYQAYTFLNAVIIVAVGPLPWRTSCRSSIVVVEKVQRRIISFMLQCVSLGYQNRRRGGSF